MYKVLVVDDDSISLAICKALLESEYEVEYTKSGLEAFGYLRRGNHPDAILLDMMMPGMSGMEMLKTLKSDESSADIPVLFLSSMDNDRFEVEGFQNGAVDFLRKPVEPELLKRKLQRQIYFSALKKENQELKEELAALKKQMGR